MPFDNGAIVKHTRFGTGRVRVDEGETVIVRFEHGIEECLSDDLELIEGLFERVTSSTFDKAISVVTKILGYSILSVNDSWGVFSRSRIALLPHQLWVCKRVLESWPTRWLVADDVGLGKTIEAGLILTPLLSSGRVRRLLILAPASLVGQWQERLRKMFDIRVSIYAPTIDTATSDYWNTHNMVVASAHTMRLDKFGRWDRITEAKPWDLVLVDEAHHLNVDEDRGRTLSYRLVETLQERGRIHSMVFFTGTPHRGKDFGFLSLLKLLLPDEFDTQSPIETQVAKLRAVMIRNNKQRVTDMKGQPLFTAITQYRETYSYSSEETRFYDKLTEFIATGKAYAAGLGQQQQHFAILVLITMQKLASSSIAAVRNALAKRLSQLKDAENKQNALDSDIELLAKLRAEDDPANLDLIANLEEQIVEKVGNKVNLNPDEIPALFELIEAADAVVRETKIDRVLEIVDQTYADRSVLFFTEYKATQALLMSSLKGKYGDGCVTFINGDGYIEGVNNSKGQTHKLTEDRQRAADRFNKGKVQFLVSTEAAGEGVDLQENCYTLIHVDLPWNPMRLHQRVGRLSRYGQQEPVDVVTVRNPDTVESRIWELLDEKLERITLAFQGAMDDPEDMRQLVIGMASPRMFTELFAEADSGLRGSRLDQWFDAKTSTFGGEDAVGLVRNLFGSVARFDFGEVADQIPKVDLPDLVPFFKVLFSMLGRRPNQHDEIRLNFKTPKELMGDFTIADQYDLLFAREPRPHEGEDVAGIGLKIVDRALQLATEIPDALAAIGELEGPIVIFALRDRLTGTEGVVKKIIVGVQHTERGKWILLKDWELLKLLNSAADKPRSAMFDVPPKSGMDTEDLLVKAEQVLEERLDNLDLPFKLPQVDHIAMLVPGKAAVAS